MPPQGIPTAQAHAMNAEFSGAVSYEINAHDTITALGEEWIPFALANDAPELAHGVVGRSLWDFIAGAATRHIYSELLTRVREGRHVAFPFRCDSPSLFRLMSMSMRSIGLGAVRFETELQVWGLRAVAPVVSLPATIRVCSWCLRVQVDREWRQPEFALARLDAVMNAEPPLISHGACPTCTEALLRGDLPLAP